MRTTLRVDVEDDGPPQEDSPPHVTVQRIGGAYSKQARLRGGFHGAHAKQAKPCGYCGENHLPGRRHCPAGKATCSKCSKFGHFASVCRSGNAPEQAIRSTRVDAHHESDNNGNPRSSFYNVLAVASPLTHGGAPPPMAAYILVGSAHIQAIVDTGAQANVLPLRLIGQDERRKLRATTITVRPFGSQEINPRGILHTDTTWRDSTIAAAWIVVDDKQLPRTIDPIISRSLAQDLGLAVLHQDLTPYFESHNHDFNK